MLERYRRAATRTAPKVGSEPKGLCADGYWVGEREFFFASERFDPSIGRTVRVPSVWTAGKGVDELFQPGALLALVAASGGRVGPSDLATAVLDMPAFNSLAVSVRGRQIIVDVPARRIESSTEAPDTRMVHSPDRRFACLLNGYDLVLKDHRTGTEGALTSDGCSGFAYGRPPESVLGIAREDTPPPCGLWSRNSQWFVTHRIDERAVPELPLVQHVPPGARRPVVHRYRYPLPEDPVPIGTLVAFHAPTRARVEFGAHPMPIWGGSPFLRRMIWFGEDHEVWFTRYDRYIKTVELVRYDLARGAGKVILTETATSGYLSSHSILPGAAPNVRTLPRSGEIIWHSDRDGWGHLYLYDAATGGLKNRITNGDWQVRDIVHVDEESRRLLFLASGLDPKADPARRCLCSVGLDGTGFRILLRHDGDIFVRRTEPAGLGQDRRHRPSYASAGVSPDGRFAVVRYLSAERGNRTKVVDLQTGDGVEIASASPSPEERPPRHFVALASDGMTSLHGLMFLPSEFDERRRYPVIDYIYPGPQFPWKPQSFHMLRAAQAMALAELGFITIMLDTRGAPIRERRFQQQGYPSMLEPQLADHEAVVRQLCKENAYIDDARIGIIGWSGGGFAAARAVLDYGRTFKVAVSCCGNHDNDRYISDWSDKYRGPQVTGSQKEQSNAEAAHRIGGKLLLISGDMDDNVHIGHTLLLVDALIAANSNFDLLIVPNAGHQVLNTSGYVQRRVWDYFVTYLLGEEPPADFRLRFEPWEVAQFERNFVLEAIE